MPRKSFKQMNIRRNELIQKEHRDKITPEELIELEDLQKAVGEYINKKYPLDTTILDEIEAKLDRIFPEKLPT